MATPKKEKPAESPGYSKTPDVAAILCLSERRVQQLTKEGVLKKYKTPAGERYKLVETVQDYIRYLQERVNAKAEAENPWVEKKAKAEAELKEAKAEIAKMQWQELEGQMHRSEDVEAIMTDLVYEIRSMITALPGRLAMDTARIKTPEEESVRIRDECNEILNALAAYQYDPEKYKRRVKERKGVEIIDEEE